MQKYSNLKIQESLDEFVEPEPFQLRTTVEKKPKTQGKGRKKKTIAVPKKPISPIKDIENETEMNNEEFAF